MKALRLTESQHIDLVVLIRRQMSDLMERVATLANETSPVVQRVVSEANEELDRLTPILLGLCNSSVGSLAWGKEEAAV